MSPVAGSRRTTMLVLPPCTLSSVDDEGAGEALEVIWEIEPGARAFERGSRPEPMSFDKPSIFDAFLDAVRWGAISSADRRTLQAPISLEPTPRTANRADIDRPGRA
jgi:hypothetical protein